MQMEENGCKLSREEFSERICQLVKSFLGEAYQTEVSHVRKNNGVMKMAIFVRSETNECIPCFYLEELYSSYCMGEHIQALAEHLANIVFGECEAIKEQARQCMKKEWVTEHMFLRLLSLEQNKKYLEDAIYVEILDLAAVVYVLTEEGPDGIKSYRLSKQIWNALDIGEIEVLFPKIVENTRRLFPETLLCMEPVSWNEANEKEGPFMLRTVGQDEKLYAKKLYVLTNTRRINGAGTLLYFEVLKQLGERFKGDFYVIPSSVHEVLLLRNAEGEDIVQLNYIINEVNRLQVEPEEVLAGHVYFYSVKEEKLFCR